MPTGLTSRFYVAGIPPGLNFELTSIKPTAPHDGYDWKGSFRRSEKIMSCTGQRQYDHWSLPYTVPVDSNNFMGEAHFEGHNGLWSSGEGAKVTIDFRLWGSTTVAGTPVSVDESGVIVVSTTPWSGVSRPDYVNVTYSWRHGVSDPVNVALGVPADMAGMPDDLHFVLAVNPQEKLVGVATETHKDLVLTLVDYALRGIFWGHEKAISWASGKIF
ncbi:hypothetical protein BC835DRAFT_1281959 [Cytidiella melzeri]|nr:hypothetical protein BC835DRAFT_1281959 [Cytidiella melzeri]